MWTIKKNNLFWEYSLLLAIIALTGFEFFFRNNYLIYLLLGPISFVIFIKRRLKIPSKALFVLSLLAIVTLFQIFYFNLDRYFLVTTVFRFSTYLFIASILNINFGKIFVRIMYIIGGASLFFYLLINLSTVTYDFLISISDGITPLSFTSEEADLSSNPNNTLIIHTIPHESIYRNSGPFWEPGMFGVFLSLAFALSIFKKGFSSRETVVLFLAGISTISTTTLLAYLVIIGAYVLSKKTSFKTIFAVLSFMILSIYAFNLPFISEKIDKDYNNRDKGYSRFGAMIFHFEQIKDSPWIGYGAFLNEDQENRLNEVIATPNGITNVVRYFGIPFSILFFYLLFAASKTISKIELDTTKFSFILFIILLIVAFSQDVTTRHFYFVLLFLALVRCQYNEKLYLSNYLR